MYFYLQHYFIWHFELWTKHLLINRLTLLWHEQQANTILASNHYKNYLNSWQDNSCIGMGQARSNPLTNRLGLPVVNRIVISQRVQDEYLKMDVCNWIFLKSLKYVKSKMDHQITFFEKPTSNITPHPPLFNSIDFLPTPLQKKVGTLVLNPYLPWNRNM